MRFAFVVLLGALLSGAGCIEIAQLLLGDGTMPVEGDNGDNGTMGNGGGGNGGGDTTPVVQLAASNAGPMPGEEVRLTCTLLRGESQGTTFTFAPDDGRLEVDTRDGVATFVVAETDVGVEFPFTCTATTAAGMSAPSNTVVVIPSAAAADALDEPSPPTP
ncbi:MAG: hypothetical protein HY763_17150 [Planctomycetes bacterium]|nr:hypothetical protein [Planctomycetota bacterium]